MSNEIRQQQELNNLEIDEVTAEIVDEGPETEASSTETPAETVFKQDREAEEFAVEFLKKVLRLRGVRIDRAQFLTAELRKRGVSNADIDRALASSPAEAGISPATLDEIAVASIDFETKKSTALSFAAGLPGGFAMIGAVPADITQFYVHAFRIMQKIAYAYGWQSFLRETEDIDDETLGKLAAFLGVMMGVSGASTSVTNFAAQVARPAIQKKIANAALTKSAWYGPLKSTLKMIGVNVTKQSFAKSVTKVVPVVGGVVSGGLTFVTLDTQSKRLMKHLREIPPPNVDAGEYMNAVRLVDEESPSRTRAVGAAFGDAIHGAVDKLRSSEPVGDEIAGEARAKRTVKGAASAFKGAVTGAADKIRSGDQDDDPASDAVETSGVIGETGATIRGAAAGAAGRLGSLVNRKKVRKEAAELSAGEEGENGSDENVGAVTQD